MGKKITLTITVTEKMIKDGLKAAGLEITNEERFAELLNSPKFAKEMATDMLEVWLTANEEDAGDALSMLFDDCVDFAE